MHETFFAFTFVDRKIEAHFSAFDLSAQSGFNSALWHDPKVPEIFFFDVGRNKSHGDAVTAKHAGANRTCRFRDELEGSLPQSLGAANVANSVILSASTLYGELKYGKSIGLLVGTIHELVRSGLTKLCVPPFLLHRCVDEHGFRRTWFFLVLGG
jgi:hypothetical protein